MERQFQRPVEYDPSLVAAAQAAQRNRETALKNDFGFESDGEASGGSDEEDERPQKKTHRKSSAADEAYGLEEFERLAEALQQANEARAIAEANAMKAEERVAELQAMSKSAKQILVAKFREQIKTLQDQVGEQKQMLTEDDELLEEMRHKLAVAEAGGEDADMAVVEAKVKEFKDIRELQRENASLKYKVEELSQTAKHTQDELNETKKELEKVKPKGGDDPASLLAKIEKLESERALLRDELKKRHLERSKLVATISQMKEAKENGDDTMDDLDLPTSAPATTSTPLDSAEKQQLLSKIKTLEEALKNAKSNGATTPVLTSASTDGKDKEALEEMVKKMDGLMKRREEEMKVWKEKAKEKLTTASNTIKKLKSEYDAVKMSNTKLKTEGSISGEMKRQLQTAAAKRKVIISRAQKQTGEVKKSLDALRAQVGSIPETVAAFGPLIAQAMKAAANKGQSELMHVKDSLKKEMALRKQLFNTIQELKGNIRVYCRVRPMSSKEQAEHTDGQVISFPTENELEVFNPEKKVSHNFEFEQIFDPAKNQEQVFEEVKDLVTSVLDGFNVCIFAYGQTGTGKTFTMQGPKDNPGVNTRALQRLFEQCAERLPDFKYDIQVTLLEIYNEKIMDLLNAKAQEPLKAIQGANGMEVQGLTYVPVSTLKDVLDVLARGSKNRHVNQTNMNADSSRSHLILSVYVQGINTVTNKQFVGKLHLIDLAGSERISRSGVQGEALKEAQNINQSLSALGNCIAARANKNAHVPYRDSSLTYLLQDSLEKNSKTLMFVQISPSKFDVSETLCSLKFAARVRTVELGKASKNEVKAGSAKTPVKK